MSTRVYLSQCTYHTTQSEDTPVCMRIQLSRATVKDLHIRLQHAYQRDDVRLVRRITVLIDLLVHHVPVEVLSERGGLSTSCLYQWRQAFLLRGMDSLAYRQGGGRRPKLTPRQKKRLVELIEAGPLVVGFETACWNSVLIRVLIWREFGVLYNRQYVCTLLHNMGFSCQKAHFVSDHLDAAKRLAWLEHKWPAIVRAATRCHGLILFEDEASFAQWGSLSSTWARRGQQPAGPYEWQAQRLQSLWSDRLWLWASVLSEYRRPLYLRKLPSVLTDDDGSNHAASVCDPRWGSLSHQRRHPSVFGSP
jgi:transposase